MINSKGARVRPRLDEVWFCEIDETERVHRFVARHEEFGGRGYSGRRVWRH